MPTPLYLPRPDPARPQLLLVHAPQPARVPTRAETLWYPRLLAHFIDLTVVSGGGIYLTKMIALAMVSLHLAEIRGAAKSAALFADVYEYGQAAIGAGVFAVLITLYFVALPSLCSQTLGLGLYGLCLEDEDGARPDARALARRLLVCLLSYASGGLLLLTSLRKRDGRLPQDRWSHTRVAKLL